MTRPLEEFFGQIQVLDTYRDLGGGRMHGRVKLPGGSEIELIEYPGYPEFHVLPVIFPQWYGRLIPR